MNPINYFESQIMSSALTAAQKFFNKGILTVGLDENLNPKLAFRTSRGLKNSKAIDELSRAWNFDLAKVAQFLIDETKIAYSGNLFRNIEITK